MQIGLPFDDDRRLSVEHLIDIEDGGTNSIENLRLVHQYCNDLANLLKQKRERLRNGLAPTRRMEIKITICIVRMFEGA